MTSNLIKAYANNRDNLISEITKELSTDERFLAAWLTGSFARDDFDSVSDLDLTVVVSDAEAEQLCARAEMVSPKTTPSRLKLFEKFGQIAVIHENNHNAPEGGTFTFTLYAESALMVDWVLIPLKNARRPRTSLLLFEKVGIPLAPDPEPETLEQRAKTASENIAFFWMMAAVTAKYILRSDHVFVISWIEELFKLVNNVKRLTKGMPWKYRRGSVSRIAPNTQTQVDELKRLCNDMLTLMPAVEEMGGSVPSSPMWAIEILLSFALQGNES